MVLQLKGFQATGVQARMRPASSAFARPYDCWCENSVNCWPKGCVDGDPPLTQGGLSWERVASRTNCGRQRQRLLLWLKVGAARGRARKARVESQDDGDPGCWVEAIGRSSMCLLYRRRKTKLPALVNKAYHAPLLSLFCCFFLSFLVVNDRPRAVVSPRIEPLQLRYFGMCIVGPRVFSSSEGIFYPQQQQSWGLSIIKSTCC